MSDDRRPADDRDREQRDPRPREDEDRNGYAELAPIGPGDTPNVAGTDEQQQPIAGSMEQVPLSEEPAEVSRDRGGPRE